MKAKASQKIWTAKKISNDEVVVLKNGKRTIRYQRVLGPDGKRKWLYMTWMPASYRGGVKCHGSGLKSAKEIVSYVTDELK